jgi:hypothetical protein
LKKLDPNAIVELDRDGWNYESGKNELEIIENTYLFEYDEDFDENGSLLTINN